MNNLRLSSKTPNIANLATGFANMPQAIVGTLVPTSPSQRSHQHKSGEDEINGDTPTVDVTFYRHPSWKESDRSIPKKDINSKKKSNPLQMFPKISPLKKGVMKKIINKKVKSLSGSNHIVIQTIQNLPRG